MKTRFCPGYHVARTCDRRCVTCKHVIVQDLSLPEHPPNTTTLADICARWGQDWETHMAIIVAARALRERLHLPFPRRPRRRRGWHGSRRFGGVRTVRRKMTGRQT